MNKKTKGAIAAGAAALLLAGGAGSFALWSDTENVGGGTITAGKLQFVGTTAVGAWYDGETEIDDISAYRIVPGQTLTYKASPTVLVEGDNLTATITATAANATGALEPFLTVGPPTVSGTGVNGNSITTAANNEVLEVSVPVTFDATTSGLDGQGAQAVLGTIALTLTQTS